MTLIIVILNNIGKYCNISDISNSMLSNISDYNNVSDISNTCNMKY